MKRLQQLILGGFTAMLAVMFMAAPALGAPDELVNGINGSSPTNASSCLFAGQTGCTAANSIFSQVANVLIFIIGAVAVIMLIIGGLRYVLSSGNSSAVEGAKNTILYAIIGIVVASLAFAAVNFVVGKL